MSYCNCCQYHSIYKAVAVVVTTANAANKNNLNDHTISLIDSPSLPLSHASFMPRHVILSFSF